MDINQVRSQSLNNIFVTAAHARRQEINAFLYQKFGGVVQDGPFRGMLLPPDTAWRDGDLAPKLLGAYEAELHEALAAVAGKNYSTVINVGCGEGYYAVGLARLMPRARVFGLDRDANAQRICAQAAGLNGVGGRVQILGEGSLDSLRGLLSSSGDTFLLVDCEGAELQLLVPEALPHLQDCDFLVECHDFLDRSLTATLAKRFEQTHQVQGIREGARDPNRYEALQPFGSLDRWLAICEFRPEMMHWLVFQSNRRRQAA